MKILVINCSGGTLRYQLVDTDHSESRALGVVERIGEPGCRVTHSAYPESCHEYKLAWDQELPNHAAAVALAVELITDPEHGVVEADGIDAVGHRIVHGGEAFTQSVLVDDAVVEGIRATIPLAPLHNPPALEALEAARGLFPDTPHVAAFDTAFHRTLPRRAYLYGVPLAWYEELGVRRYGFHGMSHACAVRRAARLLGRKPEDCNFITVHLGDGASLAAVRGGESVDTSMGMTPMAGMLMGTRCGDVDPAVIFHVAKRTGLPLDRIEDILSRESGLVGLCGASDPRDLRERAEAGDRCAGLALEMFVYRCRAFVGSYCAVLGRVDALVFTACVGGDDPEVRRLVCEGLENLGIHLDTEANKAQRSGRGADISGPGSPVRVLVVPTDEALEIARHTAEILKYNT